MKSLAQLIKQLSSVRKRRIIEWQNTSNNGMRPTPRHEVSHDN
jgi:hypothetical protein